MVKDQEQDGDTENDKSSPASYITDSTPPYSIQSRSPPYFLELDVPDVPDTRRTLAIASQQLVLCRNVQSSACSSRP